MVNAPALSVVMATYNGEQFLAAQLDSILGQTMLPDEIVVVDDCSTDSTVSILKCYAEKNHRIKFFVNEKNVGINGSFSRALQLSVGEFVFLSDQDDVWLDRKIEKMMGTWGGAPLIYSDAVVVDENGGVLHEREFDYHGEDPVRESNPWFFLHGNCVIGHNMAVTRDLIDRALPIPDGMVYDNWFALVACCTANLEIVFDPLCLHRIHSSNAMNNPATRGGSKLKSRKELGISKQEWVSVRMKRLAPVLNRLRSMEIHDKEFKAFVEMMADHLDDYENRIFNFRFFLECLRYRSKLFRHLKGWKSIKAARNLAIGRDGFWLSI